jgi:hypothetical protein
MPNEYFNIQPQYVNDKILFDSLTTEAFNKFGVDMVYYSVDYDVNYDRIWGEDLNRMIERKFYVKGYYELQQETELFHSYGIEGIDNFHIFISKTHFATASTFNITGSNLSGATSGVDTYSAYTPKRGDIIKSIYNNRWYEIVNIQTEADGQMFLQKKYAYDLVVKIRKDEHHSVSNILSGDAISAITDMKVDIYDISGSIDSEKINILYNPVNEKPANDPFNNW